MELALLFVTLGWLPFELPRLCRAAAAHVRAFKVGGIWFARLGRAQFSFCIVRRVAR
jgi:hypothetical protein